MNALLTVAVTAVAALAAGCSRTPAPQTSAHSATATPVGLSGWRACLRLQTDVTRNKGTADLATLRYIADHVTATPRLAMDARDAVKDIGHTGIAPLPLALLKDDCAKAGVHIPLP